MKELYIEIFENLKVVFERNNFDTTFFIKTYENESNNEIFYIEHHGDITFLLFDITTDKVDSIEHFLRTDPAFKYIEYDIEPYENKVEEEEGKFKYCVDLLITKYYIRQFKIKKLLKNGN